MSPQAEPWEDGGRVRDHPERKKGCGTPRGTEHGQADGLCLQEAYESVVEYFGENPKTTSPSMFFSLFSRFTKAYKVPVPDAVLGGGGCFWPKQDREGGGCPHHDLPRALRKPSKRWNSGRRRQRRIPQAGKSLQHPR